jgi:hypothetical protein
MISIKNEKNFENNQIIFVKLSGKQSREQLHVDHFIIDLKYN